MHAHSQTRIQARRAVPVCYGPWLRLALTSLCPSLFDLFRHLNKARILTLMPAAAAPAPTTTIKEETPSSSSRCITAPSPAGVRGPWSTISRRPLHSSGCKDSNFLRFWKCDGGCSACCSTSGGEFHQQAHTACASILIPRWWFFRSRCTDRAASRFSGSSRVHEASQPPPSMASDQAA